MLTLPPVSAATRERTLAALAWLWLLIAIPFLTDSACFFPAAIFLLATWVLLAVAWLVAGLTSWSRSRRSQPWWFAAVARCLGVCLTFTDAGLIARVRLSRPWLDAYACEVTPGTASAHESRWVGLFLVEQTDEEDGVVFLYTRGGFIDRHGLAYVPDNQQKSLFGIQLIGRPLDGPWHTFEWKF
jgi:hypothetical protein